MGGVKDSGSGRRHGAPGILQYTQTQTVAAQRLIPVGTPPFLRHDQYARAMLLGLRALRCVPWFDRLGRGS
jgi:succinate-semialdehyde dehydrogenase/glutarate-semialdehyde dehydrogenase